MSSRWELDDGIKSIKSAWRREHTARANLEKMLENAEAENSKLRELVRIMHSELVSCEDNKYVCGGHKFDKRVSELGIEVGTGEWI